ncbi:MAG TPA: hypothetical protein VFT16_03860 [Candidatus Saccharimonadales bacterium]|nr:hypothetical protein [Candidatus Saccharimonadales bacterium]
MNIRKWRWSRHYESSEEELLALFDARRISATRHKAEAMEAPNALVTTADKRIWLAEGSATAELGHQRFSLQPGDTIDLPTGTGYQITAGISGCVWYES